jgi:hypothetical protein
MTASAFISFGNVPITATGGVYQLCWCASGYECDTEEQYRVTMGEVLFIGPSPLNQDRTCVSGQHCVTHSITGPGLHPYKLQNVSGFRFKQDGNVQYDIWKYRIQISHNFNILNPAAATWVNVNSAQCTAQSNTEWQECIFPPSSAPFWRWVIEEKFVADLPPRPREVF